MQKLLASPTSRELLEQFTHHIFLPGKLLEDPRIGFLKILG
jgi:hypothetical protein